jgi:hypothetical protein
MSVRAYKIIKIHTKKSPTFNCWENDDVFDLANADSYNEGGLLYFDKPTITRALKDTRKYSDETISILRQILKEMGRMDYIEYWCY